MKPQEGPGVAGSAWMRSVRAVLCMLCSSESFSVFFVDVVLAGSHVALSCLENRLQTLSCSPDTLPHLPALQFGGSLTQGSLLHS